MEKGELLKFRIQRLYDDINVTNPSRAVFELVCENLYSGQLTVEDIMSVIEKYPNLIDKSVMRMMVEKCFYVIPQSFISKPGLTSKIFTSSDGTIEYANAYDDIPEKNFTDIYFWGTCGSGKSSLFGSLLNALQNKGVVTLDCKSSLYNKLLSSHFLVENGTVIDNVAGTPTTSFASAHLVKESWFSSKHLCVNDLPDNAPNPRQPKGRGQA